MNPRAKKIQNKIIALDIQEGKSCKVFGQDMVLTDPNQIKYYRTYIRQFACDNKLIGDFDDSAEYFISNEIKADLVKIEKELVDTSPGLYLALTVFRDKNLNFSVEVEPLENGEKIASLYLNEFISDTTIPPFHTFIASLTLPDDENFVPQMYKEFHLSEIANVTPDDKLPSLAKRFDELKGEQALMEEIDDIGSQIYILRTLKMLEKAGPVGAKIVKEYKQKAGQMKLDTKKKGGYSKLRRTLDEIIIKNDGFKKLELPEKELNKPIIEYTEAIEKVLELNNKPVLVGKKQNKPAEEASSGKKPVIKSASSDSSSGKSKGGKSGGGQKAKKKAGKSSAAKKSAKKEDKKKDGPAPLRFDPAKSKTASAKGEKSSGGAGKEKKSTEGSSEEGKTPEGTSKSGDKTGRTAGRARTPAPAASVDDEDDLVEMLFSESKVEQVIAAKQGETTLNEEEVAQEGEESVVLEETVDEAVSSDTGSSEELTPVSPVEPEAGM